MTINLIGVDCATQPNKLGPARGIFGNGEARLEEVTIGSKDPSIAETIAGWIDLDFPTLIALDAPLGWPTRLGEELKNHVAGQSIRVEPNQLFRRETDRFIKRMISKQPLDVGADRIARTAHAALSHLEEIRRMTGVEITLAWELGDTSGIQAIEVYPAATLMAYGITEPGYKRSLESRRRLLVKLSKHIGLPANISPMEKSDDVIDAAICVLAGADFLRGEVYAPADLELAEKEG